MKDIKIGTKLVGGAHPPVVIAEMSGNHNQSLERALDIVEAAAQAGAHGLKLQTYTADTMTLNLREAEFFIADPESLWQGRSLYDLYQEAYTPWEWHEPIKKRCESLGMFFLSTPFDASSVDFLESLDIPCYKIASFENIDLPLLTKVAQTGKPIIMSTGMASLAELSDAVTTIRATGNEQIILLKCTSTYPAKPENTNIRTIPHLRDLFDVQVGLSDHTMGVGVSVASVAMGATLIEKHFTLSRDDGGVDATFSLEPSEMKDLVIETERAWQSLGRISYGATAAEQKSKSFRRTIYVCEDIAAGAVLTAKNLRCIRPGMGLEPKYYDTLLGKHVNKAVKKGTPFSWDLLG